MICLTVTKGRSGEGIMQIPVDNILFMQFDNRLFISVHTKNEEYFAVGNLQFWESAFEKAGLNFMRLDRGVLANLDKIEALNSSYKIAYFDSDITKLTKHCTISSSCYKTLCKKIEVTTSIFTMLF